MPNILVIGASQGGVHALRAIASGLPADFAAPVLIVQHIGAAQSLLPSLLDEAGPLASAFALDREPLTAGRIYIAPPDYHMLVNDGRVELTRGPRENWARPAVDPLFRSAAQFYGPEAIAIVLSGRLNDGTAGLFDIKRLGGIAIVQTPHEAEAPDMPQSALDNVPVDYCLPVAEMPRLLNRLVKEPIQERIPSSRGVRAMDQEQQLGQPTAQTCPECGGAMREESVGKLTRFRCHIGHVMTAEVLAATQLDELENSISAVLRTLNERAALCRDLAAKHTDRGNLRAAEVWSRAAEETERREKAAQDLVGADWLHPEAAEAGE
jgi:two-component system chemotaxis response regulator CheB